MESSWTRRPGQAGQGERRDGVQTERDRRSRFRHVAFSAALRTWIDVTRWDEVCKVRAGAAASRIRMLLSATALHCVTVAWRTWVGRISLFQRLDEVDNMNSRDGAARAVRILCDLQCPKPCHSVVQSVLRSSPPTPPTPPKCYPTDRVASIKRCHYKEDYDGAVYAFSLLTPSCGPHLAV